MAKTDTSTKSLVDQDYISALPTEMLIKIFSRLPLANLHHCGSVSKHFNEVLQEQQNSVLKTLTGAKSAELTKSINELVGYPADSDLIQSFKTFVLHRESQVAGHLGERNVQDFGLQRQMVCREGQHAQLDKTVLDLTTVLTGLLLLHAVYHEACLDGDECQCNHEDLHRRPNSATNDTILIRQYLLRTSMNTLSARAAIAGVDQSTALTWARSVCSLGSLRRPGVRQRMRAHLEIPSGQYSLPDFPLTRFRTGVDQGDPLSLLCLEEAKRQRQAGCCSVKELSDALRIQLSVIPGEQVKPFAYCVRSAEAYGTVKEMLAGKVVGWRQKARVLDELYLY